GHEGNRPDRSSQVQRAQFRREAEAFYGPGCFLGDPGIRRSIPRMTASRPWSVPSSAWFGRGESVRTNLVLRLAGISSEFRRVGGLILLFLARPEGEASVLLPP